MLDKINLPDEILNDKRLRPLTKLTYRHLLNRCTGSSKTQTYFNPSPHAQLKALQCLKKCGYIEDFRPIPRNVGKGYYITFPENFFLTRKKSQDRMVSS